MKIKNKKAFTLVEILLSLALLVTLISFSVPFYQSFQFRNSLEATVDETARAIRNAQIFAQENKNDSEWGIRLDNGNVTLFQGSSYATRNTTYDQLYPISSQINITGLTEFYFERETGDTSTTGTITFTVNTEVREIEINEKGVLTFN